MRGLLVFLVLLACVFAQSTETVGYSEIQIGISGYTPKPQSVYIPQNDDRQSVSYGRLPVEYDPYGNAFITMEGDYSLVFDVEIDASKPIVPADMKFPVSAQEGGLYLEETAYSLVNDPETIQRALAVTRNSRTVMEAIRDLTVWTNSYLEYDMRYWGEMMTSSETLSIKRGVCDEFTNVYMAMARSLGIPTRVVTGIVYTGSQWQRHAWAESKMGDVWVPVDPTFAEVGMLNAFHVKLYSAPSYLFYQFPQSLEDISVLGYDTGAYSVPLSIDGGTSHTRVPPRGTFFLEINVTNYGDGVLVPTFAAQKTVGIELLSDFRQSVVLSPGETKALQWKFAAPYGERETYYVFLVGPGADEKYPVVVDPMLVAEGYSDFELRNVYAFVEGGEVRIEAEVRNIGNYDYAGVVASVTTDMGTQQQSFSLASGSSRLLEFVFVAIPGTHNYEIEIGAGESRINTFGSVNVVSSAGRQRGVFEVALEFVSAHSGWIYASLAFVIVLLALLVLLVPLREGRKIPFEEREEWGRLMKLRKG